MYSKKGFSLATVMITGTVMMVVLAFTIGSIYVSGSSLSNQHNQLIARQAAESGIARAQACIIRNSKNITWTSTNPLRPNTDCFGNTISGMSEYIYNDGKTRSTYLVNPSDVVEEFKNVAAVGKLEFLKPNSEIWKTYDHRLSAYIHTGLTFDEVVFGSLYVGSGINDLYDRDQQGKYGVFQKAVYFFTKTNLGSISSVGYNIDGTLTGFNSIQSLDFNHKERLIPKEFYTTPYKLPNPSGNLVPIKRIFTDFQGNGWMTFFLGEDGRTIYSTGSNINCDLGIGTCDNKINSSASRPIWALGESKMDLSNIPYSEKIVNIYTNSSTFLLTDNGKLYVNGTASFSPGFGYSLRGQSLIKKPSKVTNYNGSFEAYPIIKFNTDSYYDKSDGSIAVAVNTNGQLFAWGKGISSETSAFGLSSSPEIILSSALTSGQKIVDAITDGGSIWALDQSGSVWSAGKNRFGQLGQGTFDKSGTNIYSFKKMSFPNNEKIVKMTADGFSALFLSEQGNVYGTGLNNVGQLGFYNESDECKQSDYPYWFRYYSYDSIKCSTIPRKYQVPSGVNLKDIFIVSPAIIAESKYHQKLSSFPNESRYADNYRNSYVITQSGEVYGAGSNKHGQLGVGAPGDNEMSAGGVPQEFNIPQKMILKNSNSDSQVTGDENKPVIANQVRSGLGTTIVITEGNFVFTVGNNNFGQLGSGDQVEYHVPKRHRYTNLNKIWYY